MAMSVQVIFCDLGGVVVEVESDRMVHQMAQVIGRSFEEVHEAVYHRELLLPFELGRISPQDYYAGLRARLQLPWTYDQFVRVWNGIFSENRPVTAMLARLRGRCRLMALSNTNVLHLQHLRQHFPSLSAIEDWIASCDVGCRKPDPEIYALALRRAGVPAQAAVYIDDRPELVEAGERAGLRAIQFENSRQLERELRAAGMEC